MTTTTMETQMPEILDTMPTPEAVETTPAFAPAPAPAPVAKAQRPRRMLKGTPIAYLNTRYPALSHTFIEREVRAVREAGVPIATFTIRPPGAKDRIGAAHEQAAQETVCLYDTVSQLLKGQLRQAIKRPFGWLRAIVAGQKLSPPGIKARLSHVAYAFEAARLVEEMNKRGLKHIHVHMANNGAAVAMLACAMDKSLTYSLSIHGSAEFFNVQNWTLKPKAEKALFVRCISDFCKAQVMCWTDQNAWQRYHIVHCGINTELFSPRPHRTGGPLRIVTVGRLIPIKGYPVLLEACSRLSAQGLDWELTMIGDGEMRRQLEQNAQALGVSNRVKFAGPVSQEEMPHYLDHADVMVISSFMEGIPVVLMEAMAKEIAVVTTMVGGIPELIDHGVTGLMVPPASVDGLTDALSRLARDRDLVRQLGQAARQKVLDEFSVDSIGQEMRMLFDNYKVSPAPVSQFASAEALASQRRYALITPCRDEADYCRKTLDSICNQTVPPTLWLLVDDGSTDATPQILAEYAAKYPFIKIVRREDRGKRSVGPGVVDAFYHGYNSINPNDFDYVCKLDLDLDIPHTYFEDMMLRMEADPRIGTCSGKPYFRENGKLISEACGDEMSVGMIKFYRTECFKQVGGFVRQVMWDGIDCHRCRMLGWIAASWDEPELRFEHLRPMGSSQVGIFTGRMRHGFGQHFMGTGLAYMTASAIFRMTRPPLLLGGTAMWWGFVKSMLQRKPRYEDKQFRKFLRKYQWNCLIFGKSAATKKLNQQQQATWDKLAPARAALNKNATAARLADALLRSAPVGIDVEKPHVAPPVENRVIIGGVAIDNLNMDEAIERIESMIRAKKPGYVVTPNVDHIVKLQSEEAFGEAYKDASLVLPDGMPLLWAARYLKTPLKEKVSGSDLFPLFCQRASEKGYKLFFLGGRPGAADGAAAILRQQHPSLQVESYCPPMGFENDDAENRKIIQKIRDFAPDVVFVGLGAPKQENWMRRHHADYAAPVSIGVGASFDFVAGHVRRAPVLMQKLGLEWSWRLMREPRRMYRRYLIEDPRFFGIVLRQKRVSSVANSKD